jgi:quinolinate synthase
MLGRCSEAALADFASVADGHSSIQELERALAAARQEEYAVATEFNMVRRENAKVLEEAALMW